jgi:amidase
MATHYFKPDRYQRGLGNYRPVLILENGDSVITTTVCSHGLDANRERVTPGGNPVTGPFFVAGAERGDTLSVTLERICPNRRYGYSAMVIGANVLNPDFGCTLPAQTVGEWDVDIETWTATLVHPQISYGNLSVPLAPFLGCIGVAPDQGQTISTMTSGQHGGNMDYRGYTEGVTALFPVFTEGALFFLGDGHAAQGDGEIVGSGVEISMDVQFRIGIRKKKRSFWPRIESEHELAAIGNARPLDQAVQEATTELVRWMQAEYRMELTASSVLLGQTIRYDIGNFYNPAYTAAARIERRWLQCAVS